MKSERKFELFLLLLFFVFSWWLMDKSFGYNMALHEFRIARNVIGDFGLHLALIRSFSWGNNFPPELPFAPGKPLPYHYGFDLIVGLLERFGMRIDLALNGLSALSFSLLLFGIYKLSQLLFGNNRLTGILSITLFIFHSNLTFLDFLKREKFSPFFFIDLWRLPDYLHKGPFDGSQISLFFTLNTLVNQRHLILAIAISLWLLCYLVSSLNKKDHLSWKQLVVIGIMLGLLSRIHTLIFFANIVSLGVFLLLVGHLDWLVLIFTPALIVASGHLAQILKSREPSLAYPIVNPGFLAPRPVTVSGLLSYWWLNLGFALPLVPVAVALAKRKTRILFYSFFVLFIIANVFQLSYRVDHNHALINYFLIIADVFLSAFVVRTWRMPLIGKGMMIAFMLLLTLSGMIDLMALKNDFQYRLSDAPANRFMAWIKNNTDRRAVFLSREDVLDPVTLSGRFNYFGATYYSEVMGYLIAPRRILATRFFEARDMQTINEMRRAGINYIVVPQYPPSNFKYQIDRKFFSDTLPSVYSDTDVTVYKL